MLRRRKQLENALKQLDTFPKVAETFVEPTKHGGTISLLTVLFIIFFTLTEISYYRETKMEYNFGLDTDMNAKLKINIDMTVAMTCDNMGADIVDVTNAQADKYGELTEEPAYFELSPEQKAHWDGIKQVNSYLREEYHSVQDFLWKSGYSTLFTPVPSREINPNQRPDACRIHGSLEVNKVAGNFHITAGKSIMFPRGHAHIALFIGDGEYNFTHRINSISFGESAIGIVNPLDGEEKITKKNQVLYQYYITVVPTEVSAITSRSVRDAYQYSVTELYREIDHDNGSHGVSGIYFKYDLAPIKVSVVETKEAFLEFFVRICGIVGGIYATSAMLSTITGVINEYLFCRSLWRTNKTALADVSAAVPSPGVSLISPSVPGDFTTTKFVTVEPGGS